MSEIKDGGWAFPSEPYDKGISLRDWFAGHALAGLLASATYTNTGQGFSEFIAARAGEIADAMIAAREPRP
jgi:hypothetical protein